MRICSGMTQTVRLCSGGANINDSLVYILFVGVGGRGVLQLPKECS